MKHNPMLETTVEPQVSPGGRAQLLRVMDLSLQTTSVRDTSPGVGNALTLTPSAG